MQINPIGKDISKQNPQPQQVPPIEGEEPKYKIKVAINIIAYLLIFLFVYFSYTHYSQIKEMLLFNDCKIKKLENQIDLLTQIFFYFAIFIFANWVIIFVISLFTNNSKIVLVCKRNTTSSIEQFAIFMGVYAYLLIQESDIKKKEFVLLANWFLDSRLLYGLGSLIDLKTNLNLREAGSTLNATATLLLIAQAAGYNGFSYI